MKTIKIQHLFGRFSIFFLVLIVAVFAEEYSINRLCLNINGFTDYFPFIFMNAFMIVGIAYIYQKATRKLFIKEFLSMRYMKISSILMGINMNIKM